MAYYDNPGQVNDEAISVSGGKTFQVIQLADSDGNIIDPAQGSVVFDGEVTISSEVEIKNDAGSPVPANVASLGSTNDAVATSDTGTFSLISLFKRALERLSRIPTGLTVSSTRLLTNSETSSRVPTTTSVSSSATSKTILAANTSRRGLSIHNQSTATLYLSFTNPATVPNSFIGMAPGTVLFLDQQLIVTNAIYGIWSSANGTAQVTEYV
jgi:hypothetical protein